MIAQFAFAYSLFALGPAFSGLTDRLEAEKSAGRIFSLLDRKSEIDPLSAAGIILPQS